MPQPSTATVVPPASRHCSEPLRLSHEPCRSRRRGPRGLAVLASDRGHYDEHEQAPADRGPREDVILPGEEPRRRIVDRCEQCRKPIIATTKPADRGRGSRRGKLTGHPVRERLGDGVGSTSAASATPIVRATRATRDPRPRSGNRSTALERSSGIVRRGRAARRCSRASTTRARTAPDGTAGEAASSTARGRGIATARSNRSRSATASRGTPRGAALYNRTRRQGRRVRRRGTCSSSRPAGTAPETRRDPRPARLRPRRPRAVVVGTRAPSAETPAARREEARRDARRDLTRTRVRTAADHRGRGCSVMWSAEGGTDTGSLPAGSRPATEWMRVTSSASSRVRGGRIPGRRRASMVFPVPGGPCKQQVVRPRPRSRGPGVLVPDLERPPDRAPRRRRDRRRREFVGRRVDLSPEVRDDLGKMTNREPARCPRARPPVRTPQRRPLDATRRHGSFGYRKRPGRRANTCRQLADPPMLGQALG